jgi:hypothetical protein
MATSTKRNVKICADLPRLHTKIGNLQIISHQGEALRTDWAKTDVGKVYQKCGTGQIRRSVAGLWAEGCQSPMFEEREITSSLCSGMRLEDHLP